MLKKFMSASQFMAMLGNLRVVYDTYLCDCLPYKLKSISCQGTLAGCLAEVGVCGV